MQTACPFSRLITAAGATFLLLGPSPGNGENVRQRVAPPAQKAEAPAQPRALDPTKALKIERPPLELVKNSSAPNTAVAAPPRLDVPKMVVIERPTEDLVRGRTSVLPGRGEFVNPKVEPGKVRWHPTLPVARAAAAKSGKPVLLFQMLGKLDDQFC